MLPYSQCTLQLPYSKMTKCGSVVVMFLDDKTFWVVPLKSTYFSGSKVSEFSAEMLGKKKIVFNGVGDFPLSKGPRGPFQPCNVDRVASILYCTTGEFNIAIAAYKICRIYINRFLCVGEELRLYKSVEDLLLSQGQVYWRHGTIVSKLVEAMIRFPTPSLLVPESSEDESESELSEGESGTQEEPNSTVSEHDYNNYIAYLNATSNENAQYW